MIEATVPTRCRVDMLRRAGHRRAVASLVAEDPHLGRERRSAARPHSECPVADYSVWVTPGTSGQGNAPKSETLPVARCYRRHAQR